MPTAVDEVQHPAAIDSQDLGKPTTSETRVQAVLQALDKRYEPRWWESRFRRQGVLMAAVALAGVAVAAAVLGRRARYASGWRQRLSKMAGLP